MTSTRFPTYTTWAPPWLAGPRSTHLPHDANRTTIPLIAPRPATPTTTTTHCKRGPRTARCPKPRTPAPLRGSGHTNSAAIPLIVSIFIVTLATPAAAQTAASVTYAEAPDAQFYTDLGTLQGIALHAGNVLTQTTTRIAQYQDGTLVKSRDTTNDGSYGLHNGDGAVLDGRLYISTSNYPTPIHERRAAISIYNATTLAYIEEWTPQGTQTGAGGGIGTHGNSLWWPFAHKDCEACIGEQVIHELDPTKGTVLHTYPLTSPSGTYAYQSCDWLPGALLLCPNHGGNGIDYSDLYHFDGSTFTHRNQVAHASWSSTNTTRGTEYGSQGFAVQIGQDGMAWTWWAGRDAQGNGHGTGDIARFQTTITSPTPPPPPPPPPPTDDPGDTNDPSNPNNVAGGGGITSTTATGWSILAAATLPFLALLAASQHPGFRARIQQQPVTFAAILATGSYIVYAALLLALTTTTPAPA